MASENGEVKTVLQVLPHPGGGGETYVALLAGMNRYRFERLFLAPSSKPHDALRSLPRAVPRLLQTADLLHVHGEVAGAICLPVIAARPSVITLHGLHLLRRSSGAKRLAASANMRLLARAATRTICVSDAELVDVLDAAGAGARERLVMIHNGVDPLTRASADERATARAELGLPSTAVVGLWLGALTQVKDPLTAVLAARACARDGLSLRLLVVGEGPLRDVLEAAAHEGPSGAISILGYRADTRRVLAAADFFVSSSLREGLSFSLLEAMSIGLPPIVSDAPGNPEAVGDAGLVVRRGDIRGFVTAFGAIATAEARRLALGESARSRVEVHFRADEMIRRTREVYDEVAGVRDDG